MHLKISSGKWRPSCLSLNVLNRRWYGITHGPMDVIYHPCPYLIWSIIQQKVFQFSYMRILFDPTRGSSEMHAGHAMFTIYCDNCLYIYIVHYENCIFVGMYDYWDVLAFIRKTNKIKCDTSDKNNNIKNDGDDGNAGDDCNDGDYYYNYFYYGGDSC